MGLKLICSKILEQKFNNEMRWKCEADLSDPPLCIGKILPHFELEEILELDKLFVK